MMTEDEAEAWYDEEKKKMLDTYLAALEKKEKQEDAEKAYNKKLGVLFERYKKIKIEAIEEQEKNAKIVAASKAKQPGRFKTPSQGIIARLIRKVKK